jgi:hypothetical protein
MPAARWLAAMAVIVAIAPAHAADDPLRLVPRQADFVVRIDSPRKLVDAVLSTEPVRELGQFAVVKEALQTTNARRAARLIAYYEKELGAPWPELLDRLAGGGALLAGKFDRNNQAPVLFVVQGTDPELWKRAFEVLLRVIEQEQVRQDSKDHPRRDSHRGLEVVHVGNDLHMARAGAALLLSNKPEAVHMGLDLYINGRHDSLAEQPGPADAAKMVPPNPLLSLWVNLKPAQESPEGKEFFKRPKSDPAQLLFAGGLLDVIGRSPFLTMGTYRQPNGNWNATFRMPSGRDATPEGQGLHIAAAGQPGVLPPLAPPDAFYSTSFYLDLGRFWTGRESLLTDGPRKQLDQAEKSLGRFLAGRKLGELLTQVGPYHRFVAAAQPKSGYPQHPNQIIPAFAYTVSMRDPGFGKAMDGLLRGVALFVGAQAKLKLVEETIDGATLVGYRFPEDGTLSGDVNKTRFNFSPCFASVGDQFFAASTIELGRELIRTLKQPANNTPGSDTAGMTKLSATGGVALLKAFQDQVLTQGALDRALTVDQVRDEVVKFVDWVGTLGEIDTATEYRSHEFRFDVKWINHKGTEDADKSKAAKKEE